MEKIIRPLSTNLEKSYFFEEGSDMIAGFEEVATFNGLAIEQATYEQLEGHKRYITFICKEDAKSAN